MTDDAYAPLDELAAHGVRIAGRFGVDGTFSLVVRPLIDQLADSVDGAVTS